jgi:imidazoleglycerol phosphate synthase glutamine amidotransferase subunit HisH
MAMTTIIDSGVANLHPVQVALRRFGLPACVAWLAAQRHA